MAIAVANYACTAALRAREAAAPLLGLQLLMWSYKRDHRPLPLS